MREAYLRWAGWDPVADFDGVRFDDDMVDKVIPNFPADRPTLSWTIPLNALLWRA